MNKHDDSIFEYWVTVQATRRCNGWGLAGERHFSDEPGGSWKVDYPIKDLDDMEKMIVPCRESHVDITLKDVETVENDPERIKQWVGDGDILLYRDSLIVVSRLKGG